MCTTCLPGREARARRVEPVDAPQLPCDLFRLCGGWFRFKNQTGASLLVPSPPVSDHSVFPFHNQNTWCEAACRYARQVPSGLKLKSVGW